MKPRAVFVAAVLLALLAAPLAPQAQQAGKVYRVGFLTPSFAAFPLQGVAAWLGDVGYVDGRNLVKEWRSAAGRDDRLLELASELVGLKVDVDLFLKLQREEPAQCGGPASPARRGTVPA
jgi:putative ABC transport system substrate-binding protein